MPHSPWLLSACQKRQGSILEHSDITYKEILRGEKNEVHLGREKAKEKGADWLKHEIIGTQ